MYYYHYKEKDMKIIMNKSEINSNKNIDLSAANSQKKFILATDFDGTLCCEGVIKQSVIKAIEDFRNRGNLFGIVTGRDFTGIRDVLKIFSELSVDFIISNNGAQAFDENENILFSNKADGSIRYGEYTLAELFIIKCLQLTSQPCGIAFEKTKFDFHPDFENGGELDNIKYSPFSALKDVKEFVSGNAICKNPEEAASVVASLKNEFGKYLNPVQNARCIDITPAGVDKAYGIKQLADLMNIPYDNIWVSGDNYNDMPMVEKFHGCAVENAVDELKDIAEYVCEDVGDVIHKILSSDTSECM